MAQLSSDCLETLKAAYAAPHRFYHTWHHVEALVRHTGAHPEHEALYLACVFHDAVYDVLAKDNEQRSAALMCTMIEKTALRDKAEECILLCLEPFEAGESLAAYFTDVDHAILGAPRAEYVRYAEAVRAEYETAYPSLLVKHGRIAFLKKMLAQGRVFRTGWFETMLGDQARENMRAEARALGQKT